MAYIFFWIVFVAFTTTLAYRYPNPSNHPQYQGQNYEDESSEQDTSISGEYQRTSDDFQLNYQDQVESRLRNPKRSVERIIPFRYYERNTEDKIRVAPTFTNNQHHTENSSYKIPNNKRQTKADFNVMIKRGAENSGSVLFSLESKSLSRNMFIPQVQEECEESGICENSPDYPHEYVEALLAKLPDANIRFHLDTKSPEIAQKGELENGSVQTEPLCKPKYRIMYPDKARTTMGKWVFIVNGRTTKVQGFSGTLCLNEREPCSDLLRLPKGYTSRCVQKYGNRSMWALDYSGELALVTTRTASCCTCELQCNSSSVFP